MELAWALGFVITSIAYAQTKPTTGPTTLPAGLGINIHFTHAAPGELEMIEDAGFRVARMDLTWAATEKDDGSYDFAAYDKLVGDLEKHHIRPILILDYTHPKYDAGASIHTDAGRAAFA